MTVPEEGKAAPHNLRAARRLTAQRIPKTIRNAALALVVLGLFPVVTIAWQPSQENVAGTVLAGLVAFAALCVAAVALTRLRWGMQGDPDGKKGGRSMQWLIIAVIVINVMGANLARRIEDPGTYLWTRAALQPVSAVFFALLARHAAPRWMEAAFWAIAPLFFAGAAMGVVLYDLGLVDPAGADLASDLGFALPKLAFAVVGIVWLTKPKPHPDSFAAAVQRETPALQAPVAMPP